MEKIFAFDWLDLLDKNNKSVVNKDYTISLEIVYQRLNVMPEAIADFCQTWKIVELALFGSILRDDFRLIGDDLSDVDVMYVFSESTDYSIFDVMEMSEQLENLFQRKVDLVSKTAIENSRNWLRRDNILKSSRVIYVER